MIKILYRSLLPAAALMALLSAHADQSRLQIIRFDSHVLKGNPLHDPTERRAAIFIPAQHTNGIPIPVVYYLPGWGGSSENFIKNPQRWLALTQKIADQITPMLLVVVDARNRWGGSQYLNSPAQGNYADYVCREIVPLVEARFPAPVRGVRRIIAGHSSGGFGALRLGMANQKLFDAIIALSPDSDFPVSHLPLVTLPGVTNASLAEVQKIEKMEAPAPKDGDLDYAIGLSAVYAPRGRFFPGQFDWLYDARGRFRAKIWQRWLANDPLTLVREKADAFSPAQSIYLEGAAHDQYSANIGARKIYETIQNRPARCVFYEPLGRHSDHVPERLQRGLAWTFHRPLPDIK